MCIRDRPTTTSLGTFHASIRRRALVLTPGAGERARGCASSVQTVFAPPSRRDILYCVAPTSLVPPEPAARKSLLTARLALSIRAARQPLRIRTPVLMASARIAVVTGANRGLGRTVAKRLTEKGFSVIAVCRRLEDARGAVEDGVAAHSACLDAGKRASETLSLIHI